MTENTPRSKVLHLITRLDFGGSSENVIFSTRGSVKAGREVLIASGPTLTLTKTTDSVQIPSVVIPDLVRSVNPWRDLKAFFQILRLLQQEKPDIVHTHSSKAGILGRWAAWIYRRFLLPARAIPMRIIHTPHGHVFYGYFGPILSSIYLSLERITAKITDNLIALTAGEKQESLERGVGQEAQWTIIHSGVSIAQSSPHLNRKEVSALLQTPIADSCVIIGCIARLEPVKGVKILVEAAHQVLSAPGGRKTIFLIVGDGEERRSLELLSQELGLSKSLIFAGYQKDPWAFLPIMDIYVQPSLNEGMGKTLVMAQSAGLPIVASRVCGIPDVVRDGETGILVPPADPQALATDILRLLGDETLRKKMGQAANRWMLSVDETGHARFSVESMVEQLENLYGR